MCRLLPSFSLFWKAARGRWKNGPENRQSFTKINRRDGPGVNLKQSLVMVSNFVFATLQFFGLKNEQLWIWGFRLEGLFVHFWDLLNLVISEFRTFWGNYRATWVVSFRLRNSDSVIETIGKILKQNSRCELWGSSRLLISSFQLTCESDGQGVWQPCFSPANQSACQR